MADLGEHGPSKLEVNAPSPQDQAAKPCGRKVGK